MHLHPFSFGVQLANNPWWEGALFTSIIGGIFSALPTVYLVFKEIPRLEIQVKRNPKPQNPSVPEIYIHVVNKGYRSLMLRRFYFKSDGEEIDLIELDEKADATHVVNGLSSVTIALRSGDILRKAYNFNSGIVPDLYCEDGMGKVHKKLLSEDFWMGLIKSSGTTVREN